MKNTGISDEKQNPLDLKELELGEIPFFSLESLEGELNDLAASNIDPESNRGFHHFRIKYNKLFDVLKRMKSQEKSLLLQMLQPRDCAETFQGECRLCRITEGDSKPALSGRSIGQ